MKEQISRMIDVAVEKGDVSFLRIVDDLISWQTVYYRTPIHPLTATAFRQSLRKNWSAWEPLASDPALWLDNHRIIWAGFEPLPKRYRTLDERAN